MKCIIKKLCRNKRSSDVQTITAYNDIHKTDLIVDGDIDLSGNLIIAESISNIENDKNIFTDKESEITIGSEESTTIVDGYFKVNKNATIYGDLHVKGTRTVVNTKNLDISDNIIVINNNSENLTVPYSASGLMIKRFPDMNVFMGWSEPDNSVLIGHTTEMANDDLDPTKFSEATLKVGNLNITDSATAKNTITMDDMSANLITVEDINITDTAFYKDFMYFDYNINKHNPYFGWDISNNTFELAKADKYFDIQPATLTVDKINSET